MIISREELNKLLKEEFNRAYEKAKNDLIIIQDMHTKSTKSEVDNKIKEAKQEGYNLAIEEFFGNGGRYKDQIEKGCKISEMKGYKKGYYDCRKKESCKTNKIQEAKDEGYKDGQKDGQEAGAHNTWILVLKLVILYDEYYYSDWKNLFGYQPLTRVFKNYSAEEISKKLNEYERCKKCCHFPSNGISCNSICIQCEDGSKFKYKINKECSTCGWLNYITSNCKCPDECDDTKKCWKPDLDCFGKYSSEKCQKCNYEDICIDNSNKKDINLSLQNIREDIKEYIYDKLKTIEDVFNGNTNSTYKNRAIIVKPDRYEKTIDCGALPNATTKQIEHNIADIDKILKISGISYDDSNGKAIYLPHFDDPDQQFLHDMTKAILLSADKNSITISSGADRTNYTRTYVTIEYTKTTDKQRDL